MIKYSLTVVTESGLGAIPLVAESFSVPGEAYNVVRKETLSGSKQLTFNIPINIIDEQGNTIINPRWPYVRGDSIIRLQYYYEQNVDDVTTEDFIVSNIDASHDDRAIAEVTCESKALYRLSKVGYKKYFGESNAVSLTLEEAMESVLEDTEWTFDAAGSDLSTQTYSVAEEPEERYTVLFDGLKMGATCPSATFKNAINNGGVCKNFALEFFIRPRASLTDQVLFDLRDTQHYGAVAYISPEGHILYFHSVNNSELDVSDVKLAYRTTGTPIINYYKWNHIVIKYDVSGTPKVKIFHNGSEVTTRAAPNAGEGTALDALDLTTDMTFFRSVYTSSPYQMMPMGGHVAIVRGYSVSGSAEPITAADIAQNYNSALDALANKTDTPTPAPVLTNAFINLDVYRQNTLSMSGDEYKQQYLTDFVTNNDNLVTIVDYWEDPSKVGLIPPPALYFWISNIKRKTLVASNSNIFDILQTICEAFDVYPRFIDTDPNDLKLQVFTTDTLSLSEGRIAYGYNLRSANTTIDSKALVTKLFVRGPTGPNGRIITITDSESNLDATDTVAFGADYLMDFSYYDSGLYALTPSHITELDRYKNGGLTVNTVNNLTSPNTYWGQKRLFADLKDLLDEYTQLLKNKLDFEILLTADEAGLARQKEKRDTAKKSMDEYDGNHSSELWIAANNAYNDALTNISSYEASIIADNENIVLVNSQIKAKKNEIETQNKRINQEDAQFALMFAPYIKEGVWNCEDVFDPEDLYQTAKDKILTKYNRPKITSNVSFIDLYSYYGEGTRLASGLILQVIDDALDINDSFIITEISLNLSNQLESSISISNYADHLESIFNKLIVGVEALNANKDIYERAGFFDGNGAINPVSLAYGASNGQMEFNVIADGSIKISREGIVVADYINDAALKISVGGIYTKTSSDNDFRLLFSSKRLSVPEVTAGRISTAEFSIFGGSDDLTADVAKPSFIWNGAGIYAFGPQATYSDSKYLRLYEKGMEMYDNDPTNYHNLKLFIGNISNVPNAQNKVLSLYPDAILPLGYGLLADNVFLSGGIVANYGTIGGWKINPSNLESKATNATTGLYLDTDGNIRTKNFISGDTAGAGWSISESGRAEFQDIVARGSIKTAVFQMDKVSAIGGSMYVRQAWVLNGQNSNSYVTLTNNTYSNGIKLDSNNIYFIPKVNDYIFVKTNSTYAYLKVLDAPDVSQVVSNGYFKINTHVLVNGSSTTFYKGDSFVSYGGLATASNINNLIKDGSFELNLATNYTVANATQTNLAARFGTNSIKLAGSALSSIKQTVTGIISGHTYGLTYTSRALEINDFLMTEVGQGGGTTTLSSLSDAVWLRTIGTFAANSTSLDVTIKVTNIDKDTYVDGLMLLDLTQIDADTGLDLTNASLSTLATFIEARGGFFDVYSETNSSIEGGIFLTSTEANSPYIDMYRNVATEEDLVENPFQYIRYRSGRLDGINDSYFGALSGYGLYSDNVYLRGGIMAEFGAIGGWSITGDMIHSTNNGIKDVGFSSTLIPGGSPELRIWAGATTSDPESAVFKVYRDGAFQATSATISGSVTATAGAIGGWTITATELKNSAATVHLYANGAININSVFTVTNTGIINATSGTIGGWTIGASSLLGGSTYLYSNGQVNFGSYFSVNATGYIIASNGTIGGWTILVGQLNSGSTNLFSNGTAQFGDTTLLTNGQINAGTKFSVNSTGVMRATDGIFSGSITATTGSIGGFSIGANYLSKTGFIINTTTNSLTIGTGNEVIVLDSDYGMWIGYATSSSAEFKVTKAGALTATSGSIGGWKLSSSWINSPTNATILYQANGTAKFGAAIISGTGQINIGAGFSVGTTGAMVATSGSIGGWTISNSGLNSGGTTINPSGSIYLVAASGSAGLVGATGSTYLQSWQQNVVLTANASGKAVKVVNTDYFSVDVDQKAYINSYSHMYLNSTTYGVHISAMLDLIELRASNSASYGIRITSGIQSSAATPVHIDTTTGRLTYYSSSKDSKNLIKVFDTTNAAKALLNIPVWSFNFKNEEVPYATTFGYVAEDLEDAGIYDLLFYSDGEKPLSIQYSHIGIYAMSLIKDLYKEIDLLKQEIEILKSKEALSVSLKEV